MFVPCEGSDLMFTEATREWSAKLKNSASDLEGTSRSGCPY